MEKTQNKMITPLCPLFGSCGGCAYQDLSYEQELALKEENLRRHFASSLPLPNFVFESLRASPEPYDYRTKIDLTYRRFKDGESRLGFLDRSGRKIISIEKCFISRPEISKALPEIFQQAKNEKFISYKRAYLAVKTDASGRVRWGGMGRRSLEMPETDYLFAEVGGKKIFYSLNTFFQVNHMILPRLMETLESLAGFNARTTFYDLYGGVGLFSVYFSDRVKKAILVEECPASIQLAKYNKAFHRIENMEIRETKMETLRSTYPNSLQAEISEGPLVAMVDPPRKGLSPQALEILGQSRFLNKLFYLSCNPETLVRDLKVFCEKGWKIEKVIPFDFFPRTKHLETLVMLKPKGKIQSHQGTFKRGPAPLASSTSNLSGNFQSKDPLEIEIGCGKGKFLLERAARNPEIQFLGIDRIGKWMSVGAGRAEKKNLTNLEFHKGTIQDLLLEIPDQRISIFHIYFPDPWPKRRHRRRRIVNAVLLSALHRCLGRDGLIEFATDDLDYFQAVKKEIQAAGPLWKSLRESLNQRILDPERATNYEMKYRAAGKTIYYLELKKGEGGRP